MTEVRLEEIISPEVRRFWRRHNSAIAQLNISLQDGCPRNMLDDVRQSSRLLGLEETAYFLSRAVVVGALASSKADVKIYDSRFEMEHRKTDFVRPNLYLALSGTPNTTKSRTIRYFKETIDGVSVQGGSKQYANPMSQRGLESFMMSTDGRGAIIKDEGHETLDFLFHADGKVTDTVNNAFTNHPVDRSVSGWDFDITSPALTVLVTAHVQEVGFFLQDDKGGNGVLDRVLFGIIDSKNSPKVKDKSLDKETFDFKDQMRAFCDILTGDSDSDEENGAKQSFEYYLDDAAAAFLANIEKEQIREQNEQEEAAISNKTVYVTTYPLHISELIRKLSYAFFVQMEMHEAVKRRSRDIVSSYAISLEAVQKAAYWIKKSWRYSKIMAQKPAGHKLAWQVLGLEGKICSTVIVREHRRAKNSLPSDQDLMAAFRKFHSLGLGILTTCRLQNKKGGISGNEIAVFFKCPPHLIDQDKLDEQEINFTDYERNYGENPDCSPSEHVRHSRVHDYLVRTYMPTSYKVANCKGVQPITVKETLSTDTTFSVEKSELNPSKRKAYKKSMKKNAKNKAHK